MSRTLFSKYFSNLPSEPEAFSDADMAFSAFLGACLASPNDCVLAGNKTSTQDLEASIWKMINDIKYQPIEIEGSIVEYITIKSMIRSSLYNVEKFPGFAKALNGLLVNNGTQYLEGAAELAALNPPVLTGDSADDSPYGIHCSDKRYRRSSLEEMIPDIEMLEYSSKIMGDNSPVLLSMCAQWKMSAKEHYEGDFQNIRTKTPVMLIGNTFDSATSIKGAFNVSSGFVDSVVLRQDGFGVSIITFLTMSTNELQHGSLGQASLCTAKAVKTYFMDGVLPAQGAVCAVDVAPFSGKTFDDFLPELGFDTSKILEVQGTE